MITSLGLGCPRVALGLNGPSFPYPLRPLQGLGDEATPTNIAAVQASVDAENVALASYVDAVTAISGGRATRVPGYVGGMAKVPDYYIIDIGSYSSVVNGAIMNQYDAATWGAQLARNAAQANAIVVSTPQEYPSATAVFSSGTQPIPIAISRMPIRTPMPTPVQPPSQLQIYQPKLVTDVRLATAQPVGVTPTTGPTTQLISAPPIQQAGLVTTGVQTQYAPVSTDSGYAGAGADGQVATSPIGDFLQGTMIGSIPNWLLIVGAIGAFALYRQHGR